MIFNNSCLQSHKAVVSLTPDGQWYILKNTKVQVIYSKQHWYNSEYTKLYS